MHGNRQQWMFRIDPICFFVSETKFAALEFSLAKPPPSQLPLVSGLRKGAAVCR
jgi:hypothetical protein